MESSIIILSTLSSFKTGRNMKKTKAEAKDKTNTISLPGIETRGYNS